MQKILSTEGVDYLKAPVKQFGLVAMFIALDIYGLLANTNPHIYSTYIVILLSSAAVVALIRLPKWIVYTLLFVALVVHLFVFVHIIANWPHDQSSTRDTAVEVAAQALLHGQNAWNVNIGVPVTTGPTSILLAIPFVILFGEINWLSFCFWLVFFLVLLLCDIYYRNNTWPTLIMIFMLGSFGFVHTLYWSLEELYYPILYLALAYFLVKRNLWLVGALLAASVLSRISYVFMVFGFGLWYLFSFQFNWQSILKIGLGFVLGSVVILLPFVIIGGKSFWSNNALHLAFDMSASSYPNSNFVFQVLNQLNVQIGAGAMRFVKLGLTTIVMCATTCGLQRAKVHHPFWHITTGSLLAHTLVWCNGALPNDYVLIFVLPAMLAIAMITYNNLDDPRNLTNIGRNPGKATRK